MISIFLPIRKGSKRIKNKNIKPLPHHKFGLTEIKINQLKKLKKKLKKKLEFVVSTDCDRIKKYLLKFPWIRVNHRPKNLATDDSLDKLIHYVPKICNGEFILWTHVTSPLFNEKDYEKFINDFFKKVNKRTKSAFSADRIQKFILNSDRKWISHNRDEKKWPRTQDLQNFYIVNSAAFIAKREIYTKYKDRLCNKPLPLEIRTDSGFDIDEIQDFNLLKKKIINKHAFR